METFREKIAQNEVILREVLVVNNKFLTLLVRAKLLDVAECMQIQDEAESSTKVETTLRVISERSSEDTYAQFLQVLHKTDQNDLADLLTDVNMELADISRVQATLGEQLQDMKAFLGKEERRTQVGSELAVINGDSLNEADPTGREDIRKALAQFERCKTVILKLHEDCNSVARLNSDILDQVRQCDANIRENLNYKKRGNNTPRKSQDVFDQLVKDINDLTKRHGRDQAKETEVRIPCLRMIRQFNDWVQGRIVGLRSVYNAADVPKINFNEMALNDEEFSNILTELNTKALEATGKDPLLDAINKLEHDLQRYINYEKHVSEECRRLRRVRQLQKTTHSYTPRILHEAEETLRLAETEENRSHVQKIRGYLDNMATEYDECMSLLDKHVRYNVSDNAETEVNPDSSRSPKQTPRNRKSRDILKAKQISSSNDSSRKHAGRSPRRNAFPTSTLLQKIQNLVAVNEQLRDETSNLKAKYRSELDRKKRENELSLKKSKDQNAEMLLKLQELEAEKEKFKKLYSGTKVSYIQRIQSQATAHALRKEVDSPVKDSSSEGVFMTQKT